MTAPHTSTAAAATRDRARVATDDLRWRCPPSEAGITAASEAEPIRSVIGQDDAVDALRFGLEIDAPGWDAGLPDENGRYPEGTLLARAMERAAEFWRVTQPESSADPPAPSQRPDAAG